MTITITPKGSSYEAYVSHKDTDGTLLRDRRRFPSQRQAQNWAQCRERELATGRPSMESPSNFGELADRAYAHFWKKAKSWRSQQSNIRRLKIMVGPKTPLSKITSATVDRIVNRLETHNGPAAINRKLTNLRRMLKWAVTRGWMSVVPEIPFYKEPPGRTRIPKPEEIRVMVDTISAYQEEYGDLVLVLSETGLRVSEALALEARDVDLGNATITVRDSKNRKPRTVPLLRGALGTLKARLEVSPLGPFQGLKSARLNHLWSRAKRELGLDMDLEFVPHCLRHGVASRLVQAGVNLRSVQEILGHRSIQTTIRYAHLDVSSLRTAMEVLEARPSEGGRVGT